MQAILASFMVRSLGMDDAESFVVFGAFSAMVYGYVSIGGILGDKLLGTQRTIILGAATLTIGYLIMALAGADKSLVFLSLGVIACGNGLFKANPSSLLAKLYDDNPQKLDSAFTVYYMSINIGSFISMILVPIVGGRYGMPAGFSICVMGLVIALGSFLGYRRLLKGIDSPAGKMPLNIKILTLTIIGIIAGSFVSAWLLSHLSIAHAILVIIGIIGFGCFISMIVRSSGAQRKRMLAALILIAEAIVFWMLYQQMPTSINFFSIKNVEHTIFGLTVSDPEVFQTLNPMWIMILSPMLAFLYSYFGERGKDLSMPAKFTLGMFMNALSFLLLSVSGYFASEQGIVSVWWIVGSYLLSGVGELLIAGLGLSMISKLVPPKYVGFLMGVWFMITAISAVLGGFVATLTAVPKDVTDPVMTLSVYTKVFGEIGVATLVVSALMALGVPYLRKLTEAKD